MIYTNIHLSGLSVNSNFRIVKMVDAPMLTKPLSGGTVLIPTKANKLQSLTFRPHICVSCYKLGATTSAADVYSNNY